MSQVDLTRIVVLLREFTQERKTRLEITLLGGLALQYYGMEDRATVDIDAEVKGDLEGLFHFLKIKNVPADLGEDVSGWSVIAMPPGYRDRSATIYKDALLEVKVLNPLDFIIAKLRRFTEEDIQDALFVAEKYKIDAKEIERSAEETIHHSIKDTALFLFRENLQLFLKKMRGKFSC